MTYLFATILAALTGLAGWLYKLFRENRNLKEKVANEAAQSQIKEWSDQVVSLDGKIKEDERDYEEKKKHLETHSGSKPIPPGGQQ